MSVWRVRVLMLLILTGCTSQAWCCHRWTHADGSDALMKYHDETLVCRKCGAIHLREDKRPTPEAVRSRKALCEQGHTWWCDR